MCSLLHQRFSVNFKSKLPYWKEMHTNPEKYPTRVFVLLLELEVQTTSPYVAYHRRPRPAGLFSRAPLKVGCL